MSVSIVKITKKDGTTYAVNDSGAIDISIRFQVQLSGPLPHDQLFTTFTDGTTHIPAIGTVHPERPGYFVARYDVRQPEGSAKHTLDVTVVYESKMYVTEGSGQDVYNSNVEQWGWDNGTSQHELTTDADGNAVLNSAKDPFDSVPMIESPAPTFTKVVRFASRQSGWFAYNCSVNDSNVTIGGVTFNARTLLCTIAESVDPTNEEWPYKYTINLRYRSNWAKIGGSGSNTQCGWDVVICDAGMREVDATTGKLKLIQVISAETGNPATVTSPELLDGSGHAVVRDSEHTPTPYNFRVTTYSRRSFPAWFYSEPSLAHRASSSSNSNSNS